MIPDRPYRLILNRRHGTPGIVVLPEGGFRRARAEITAWPGYAPTPLLALGDIAKHARIAALHYKDEAPRFGLGSFKALGGAYAVLKLLVGELARRGVANNATAAELEAGAHAEAAKAITVTCAPQATERP
jgi:diaminopropionate ammonia-lyase